MGLFSAKEFTPPMVGEGRNDGRHLLAWLSTPPCGRVYTDESACAEAVLNRLADETVRIQREPYKCHTDGIEGPGRMATFGLLAGQLWRLLSSPLDGFLVAWSVNCHCRSRKAAFIDSAQPVFSANVGWLTRLTHPYDIAPRSLVLRRP